MIGTKYTKQMLRITFLCMLISVSGDVTATSTNWFSRGISHASSNISHIFDRLSTRCAAIGSKLTKRDLGIATATLSVLGLSLSILGYKKYQAQQRKLEEQSNKAIELAAKNANREMLLLEAAKDQVQRAREEIKNQLTKQQNAQADTFQRELANLGGKINALQIELKTTENLLESNIVTLSAREKEIADYNKKLSETVENDKRALQGFLNQGETLESIETEELKTRCKEYIQHLQSEHDSLKMQITTQQEELTAMKKQTKQTAARNAYLESFVTPAIRLTEGIATSDTFKNTTWDLLLHTNTNALLFAVNFQNHQEIKILHTQKNQSQNQKSIDTVLGETLYVAKEEVHYTSKLGNLQIQQIKYPDVIRNSQILTTQWEITPAEATGVEETKEDCQSSDNNCIVIFPVHGTNSDSDGFGYDFNHLTTQALLVHGQKIALATKKKVYIVSYEWSGALDALNNTDRLAAGIQAAIFMQKVIQKLNPSRIIGTAHSHGCNVLNTALQALKNPAILNTLSSSTFGQTKSVASSPITFDEVWYISPPSFVDKELEKNDGTYNAKNIFVIIDDADYTGRLGSKWSRFRLTGTLDKPHSTDYNEVVRTITLKYDGLSLNHINVTPICLKFASAIHKYIYEKLPLAFESVINIFPQKMYTNENTTVWGIEGCADCLPRDKESAAPEPETATETLHKMVTSNHHQYVHLMLGSHAKKHASLTHQTTTQTNKNFKARYAPRHIGNITPYYKAGEYLQELTTTVRFGTTIASLKDFTADPLLQELFLGRPFKRPTTKVDKHWIPTEPTNHTPITLNDITYNLAGMKIDSNGMPIELILDTKTPPQTPAITNPAAGGPEPVPAPAQAT